MNTNLIQRPVSRFAAVPARLWLVAALSSLALLLPRDARADAAPANFMTYQGFLVDASGTPLATNTPVNYPVVFRIYSNASVATPLWSEQQVVTVDRGQFSVVLGEGANYLSEPRPALSTIFNNATASDRYLGITVTIGGSPFDILPRLRLVPSPYSFLSANANRLINASNGVAYVSFNTANNRTEVAGNLFASGVISGNGSGLTGLTAGQIPALSAATLASGTLADARLSGNVALRAGGNAFTGNQTVNSGSVGIGVVTPGFPLSFANAVGDKISLFGQSGVHHGFGVQANLLQIHSDVAGSDIAFGYGTSASFTETMRIKGNGNVGIGTNNPTSKLVVAGNLNVTGQLTVGTNSLNPIGASEALRVVRGRVDKNGTNILAGSGFTTTRIGVGVYLIDIPNTFSALPVVTVNSIREKSTTVQVDVTLGGGGTSARCDLAFWRFDKPTGDFISADMEFNFIAVGPR